VNGLLPSKAAELTVASWLLEMGWEVFVPIVDVDETDFVVRIPGSSDFEGIQVKSTQRQTRNAGQLDNKWSQRRPKFNYLIFIEGKRERGVILPRDYFTGRGRTQLFFANDREGYSRGTIRPVFRPFGFDLRGCPNCDRAARFAKRFLQIYNNPPPFPPVAGTN